MDAIKNVLGAFLAYLKEVFVAIEFAEGIQAIEDILAKIA